MIIVIGERSTPFGHESIPEKEIVALPSKQFFELNAKMHIL